MKQYTNKILHCITHDLFFGFLVFFAIVFKYEHFFYKLAMHFWPKRHVQYFKNYFFVISTLDLVQIDIQIKNGRYVVGLGN